MAVSPLEDRYRTEMCDVFSEEQKIKKWMEVEIALARAHAKFGNIPKEAVKAIEDAAKDVRFERVKEIEKEIHHDLMAVVKAMSERAGKHGSYVHVGATSYDIEDSATALILKDAINILEKEIDRLADVLAALAAKHKKTVCIGRTHGQHAVPTTYGMKFALYLSELMRNKERLEEAKKRMFVGKMSGAVGTMAGFGKHALEIEKETMSILRLNSVLITNQIIQRDRLAEAMFVLILFGCLCEKIAKEIRNLQRNEICELSEPFGKSQVGSSTMPHKRNPHKSERICSLARLVRANVMTALENISLEHERDLTNSANERFILSETFIIVHYMLKQLISVLRGLVFFPENIKNNLERTNGLIMAERIMLALVEKGYGRQEAHELVRKLSMDAFSNKRHLKDVVRGAKLFKEKELTGLFDYSTYMGEAEHIVENVLERFKKIRI